MSNVLLGYQNNVLTSTLSAGSEAAGLGVVNLQNDQGAASAAWQTTAATTTSYMAMDSGSTATTWRAFGIFRTNLTAGATVRWRVGTVSTFASGVTYDSGVVSAGAVAGYQQSIVVAGTPVAGRYARVDIVDAGNPDGFLNVPLMYAGPVLQPTRNIDYSSAPSRVSQTAKATTRAGGVIIRNDWNKRTFDLSFSYILPAEVASFRALDLWARQGNNVLFVFDPATSTIAQDSIFGEMEPSSGFSYPSQSALARGWRATMTERL